MDTALDYREISDRAVMSVKPVVSVFMLAYRHERFLAQAIESVVTQECDFPFELIISEDCSPDGTLEIALDYQRRYPQIIRVLTADRNVGMIANSERRITAMRGKYMASCEGDDCWNHPRKLQMQIDLMAANPGMSVCHSDYDRESRFRFSRRKHARKGRSARWLAEGMSYRDLLLDWPVATATTIYDRDVYLAFKKSEFARRDWPFGDYNLCLFASLQGTVGYVDESTATYRKIKGSSTNQDRQARLRMILATLECVDLFMSRYPVSSGDTREIRARLVRRIYRAAFYAEREDLMVDHHAWLRDNGFNPSGLSHRLRLLAVRAKAPIRLLRATKNFIGRHLHSISAS